ncbi:hypothetical protein [[Mycoplasma] testudinis]|uniref:hypothetical protein n=1 Tax=[Mycoplasma] testudinis TaxID=33924 RepID=UPI0004825CD9|nr:hypothetical protein [[Mycoplasma] testudinis]
METKTISFHENKSTINTVKYLYEQFGWTFSKELEQDVSQEYTIRKIELVRKEEFSKLDDLRNLEKQFDSTFNEFDSLNEPKNPFSLWVLFFLFILGAVPALIYAFSVYPSQKHWNDYLLPEFRKKQMELIKKRNDLAEQSSQIIKQININLEQK